MRSAGWRSAHACLLLVAGALTSQPLIVRAEDIGIVLIPSQVWWDREELPNRPQGLHPESAYLFRRSNPTGVLLNLPRLKYGSELALSPGADFVAYEVNHMGEPGPVPVLIQEVLVAEMPEYEVASFANGVRFAWSPDGSHLAVAIASVWDPIPPLDSVVIWSPEKGNVLARRVPPSRGRMWWTSNDTLVVGRSVLGPGSALSLATGNVAPSRYTDSAMSPDGLFSTRSTSDPLGFGIYEDRSGANLADSIVPLLGLPKHGRVSTRWVAYPGQLHSLVVSSCTPWSESKGEQSRRECRTILVDLGSRNVIGWTTGRFVGLTANSAEVVVARGSELVFLGANDWNPPPAGNTAAEADSSKQ